jgi:hypothetical protein
MAYLLKLYGDVYIMVAVELYIGLNIGDEVFKISTYYLILNRKTC